jgi:hypothetical protein
MPEPEVTLPYNWVDADGVSHAGTITVTSGEAELPLVVLLHGNGGNADHMVAPDRSPGSNYDYGAALPPDRSIGWRAYPGVGVWSFELDPSKAVRGWQPVLADHGFRTVTYSQVDPEGLLARPVRELTALVRALTTTLPSARLAFLAHSRGGLLLRQFLKDTAGDPLVAGHVAFAISLHSPHGGSELAVVANALDGAIDALRSTFGALVDAALGWLSDIVNSPSYQELAVGSPFLTALEKGEVAIPGVAYHTFGGDSPLLTRIRSWVYTVSSAIPQWHWPPFRHRITCVEVPVASPVLDSLPNLTPEITEGVGDILVADARAHLSFALQHTNHLNHAEALWNPGLQSQILRILGATPSVWG